MHETFSRAPRTNKRASDVDRDALLAVVSHELRNQINSILGWAVLMNQPVTDKETFARGLKTIERDASMQALLIEQLIDLSRVRIDCLKPRIQKTSLASILETAVDSMMPLASEKGIQITSDLKDSRQVVNVNADPRLLQQAINNLLVNAIKFTPAGGRVDLRLATRGARAEITISDTGRGIRRELLYVVFDPFKQVDPVQNGRNGLGLGLTIARHIIVTHKGTITAYSPGEGKGTTFTITLPLAQTDSQN